MWCSAGTALLQCVLEMLRWLRARREAKRVSSHALDRLAALESGFAALEVRVAAGLTRLNDAKDMASQVESCERRLILMNEELTTYCQRALETARAAQNAVAGAQGARGRANNQMALIGQQYTDQTSTPEGRRELIAHLEQLNTVNGTPTSAVMGYTQPRRG